MKYKMYVNFDKVSGFYSVPWVQVSDECAKRQFQKVVSSSGYNPADFTLYCVGEFNTETGQLDCYPQNEFICHGGNDA